MIALLVTVFLLALQGSAQQREPVRVMAASSLASVLTELGDDFAASHDRPRPRLAFAGSSQLVAQLREGASADIVVTADERWMDDLENRGLVETSTRAVIAQNRLVIATPLDSSTPITTLAHLVDDRFATIAVAPPPVPAGARAREALAAEGVLEEVGQKFVVARNARAALALVARGTVDAGIVYRSDALSSETVHIAGLVEGTSHAAIRYPVALTPSGKKNPDALAFVATLRSDDGSAAFRTAGFGSDETTHAPSHPREPRPQGIAPLWLSLWVASLSLLLSVGPAVGLGWLLARREFVGKTLISVVLFIPLVLPPVVVGFLLLSLFGRNGVLFGLVDALGIQVAFHRFGAVVAAAVVGFPLLVLMSRLAIEAVDRRYAELAQTLGCTAWGAFRRVTLPLAAPGLAAGCVLAFARALGEFGATAVLASDVPGETRTLALAIFALYEEPGRDDEARTLVWISVGVCAVALLLYEWLNRVQKRRRSGG